MTLFGFVQLFRGRPRRRLAQQDAYGLWAESYLPAAHNAVMAAEQSIVEPIVRASKPRRALDVGTGTGRYMPLLKAAGARQVIGVDLSLPMLRQNTSPARICADARRLPFRDAAFNLVSSSLMVGDVDHPGSWVIEASRVLADGGALVYSDFHPCWVERDWRRTFRTADGELVELAFHPHTIEQHLASLEDASFEVRAIREPRVASIPAPVVVVFHAVKRPR